MEAPMNFHVSIPLTKISDSHASRVLPITKTNFYDTTFSFQPVVNDFRNINSFN